MPDFKKLTIRKPRTRAGQEILERGRSLMELGRLPAKMALIFHAFLCQQLLRCYLTASPIRRQVEITSPAPEFGLVLGHALLEKKLCASFELTSDRFYTFLLSVLVLCWLPRGQGQNKNKIDDERYMFMPPLWSKSAVGQLINDK